MLRILTAEVLSGAHVAHQWRIATKPCPDLPRFERPYSIEADNEKHWEIVLVRATGGA